MRFNIETLPANCGVGVLYSFGTMSSPDWPTTEAKEIIQEEGGGIGYNIAGFINNKSCHDAYQWIKENYEIVFQSPVKINDNSGNRFFFIVFKEKA